MKSTNKMFAVLCESASGVDFFGNPTGEPILIEQVGCFDYFQAKEAAEKFAGGKFGRVMIVEIKPVEEIEQKNS